MGKEGNNYLKSVSCFAPMIVTAPAPSYSGKPPIHHPRAPPQSPKLTKNATKMKRSDSYSWVRGELSPEIYNLIVPLICPTLSPFQGGTSLIITPGDPLSLVVADVAGGIRPPQEGK